MLSTLHRREIDHNPERIYNLRFFGNRHDWSGLQFPLKLNDIHIFQKNNNNIAVNVFRLDDNENVIHLIRSKFIKESEIVVKLLLVENHYTAIRNFNRLLNKQVTNHK